MTVALNTIEARNRNLAAVFQAIAEHPNASRKELNSLMPFSLQTMTNVAQELLDMGVVQENERPTNGLRGNPHRGLSIVGERGFALAVQFRWNACILALVDLKLEIREHTTVPIDTDPDDAQAYVTQLCAIVADALKQHTDKDIWSIAISGPLPMEMQNMPTHGFDDGSRLADQRWFSLFASQITSSMLGQRMEREFGLPVKVFNNTHAAALAQAQILPPGTRFVSILVGLGLGTAFISSGALSKDVWKHGGEMGHVVYRDRTLSSVLSASGVRLSLDMSLPHGEMEAALERMALETPDVFDPWLHEAAPIFRFLVNFVEAALWPDGIAVAGFLPAALLDRLIAAAMPLEQSVVLPADDQRRVLPRLFRAKRGAESIVVGAACGVLSPRANPDFANLIARRRG